MGPSPRGLSRGSTPCGFKKAPVVPSEFQSSRPSPLPPASTKSTKVPDLVEDGYARPIGQVSTELSREIPTRRPMRIVQTRPPISPVYGCRGGASKERGEWSEMGLGAAPIFPYSLMSTARSNISAYFPNKSYAGLMPPPAQAPARRRRHPGSRPLAVPRRWRKSGRRRDG